MSWAARTDVGMIRSGNEDNFDVDANKTRGIFVVADGMGGHAAGEVASEMAVQIVIREMKDITSVTDGTANKTLGEALKDLDTRLALTKQTVEASILLDREVNVTRYTQEKLDARRTGGFLNSVLAGPKQWLVGDERLLQRGGGRT